MRPAMRPITAADVMNPNVLMVQEDMTLEELASFLVENEPDFFVREWGDALSRDEVEELRFGQENEMRVRDIMTPAIYSVDAETPIPELAETLINSHIHRLLVTSGGKVAGIVTTSDLLGLLVREPE